MTEMKARILCFGKPTHNFRVTPDSMNTFNAMRMLICRARDYPRFDAAEQTPVIVKRGEGARLKSPAVSRGTGAVTVGAEMPRCEADACLHRNKSHTLAEVVLEVRLP